MINVLYVFLSALTFRIRGGLRIPFTDKKFPLCKWWFAVWFAILACILKGWSLNFFIIMTIATMVSTSCYGWGEAVSCVCGVGKVNPDRKDCELIDDIMDNAKITIKGKTYSLTDFPILWGWCWVSLRGLILSFIMGLAINSIPFMLCGLAMGTIYYLGGLFARKVLKKNDKTGWNISEICWGMALGIFLILFA